ncbi:MAG: hypothetical protein GYA23_01690 [Methanomicrobiales archaeon]|nr:hypothetical protein [Methanomicrobiales archaeon]
MKDDAVAPVVAAMLVLAVIVTLFSAWNAVYLPSLKQQSEITQARDIENAFTRFSSDLSAAASLRRTAGFSEPMPLGGGNVIFSPVTSAGTLRVNEEPKQLYSVTIIRGTTTRYTEPGRLVNFSYRPVQDFWTDQGYVWHYGYVNVTKGSPGNGADAAALSSPLQYPSMNEVATSPVITAFAGSLISMDDEPWSNATTNCSRLTLSAVTFHREPKASYTSSNGIGTLALTADVNETPVGILHSVDQDRIVIRVSRSVPDPFSSGLFTACNQSFARLNRTYPHNIAHSFGTTALYNETAIAAAGDLPFDLTYRHIAINVSAI